MHAILTSVGGGHVRDLYHRCKTHFNRDDRPPDAGTQKDRAIHGQTTTYDRMPGE